MCTPQDKNVAAAFSKEMEEKQDNHMVALEVISPPFVQQKLKKERDRENSVATPLTRTTTNELFDLHHHLRFSDVYRPSSDLLQLNSPALLDWGLHSLEYLLKTGFDMDKTATKQKSSPQTVERKRLERWRAKLKAIRAQTSTAPEASVGEQLEQHLKSSLRNKKKRRRRNRNKSKRTSTNPTINKILQKRHHQQHHDRHGRRSQYLKKHASEPNLDTRKIENKPSEDATTVRRSNSQRNINLIDDDDHAPVPGTIVSATNKNPASTEAIVADLANSSIPQGRGGGTNNDGHLPRLRMLGAQHISASSRLRNSKSLKERFFRSTSLPATSTQPPPRIKRRKELMMPRKRTNGRSPYQLTKSQAVISPTSSMSEDGGGGINTVLGPLLSDRNDEENSIKKESAQPPQEPEDSIPDTSDVNNERSLLDDTDEDPYATTASEGEEDDDDDVGNGEGAAVIVGGVSDSEASSDDLSSSDSSPSSDDSSSDSSSYDDDTTINPPSTIGFLTASVRRSFSFRRNNKRDTPTKTRTSEIAKPLETTHVRSKSMPMTTSFSKRVVRGMKRFSHPHTIDAVVVEEEEEEEEDEASETVEAYDADAEEAAQQLVHPKVAVDPENEVIELCMDGARSSSTVSHEVLPSAAALEDKFDPFRLGEPNKELGDFQQHSIPLVTRSRSVPSTLDKDTCTDGEGVEETTYQFSMLGLESPISYEDDIETTQSPNTTLKMLDTIKEGEDLSTTGQAHSLDGVAEEDKKFCRKTSGVSSLSSNSVTSMSSLSSNSLGTAGAVGGSIRNIPKSNKRNSCAYGMWMGGMDSFCSADRNMNDDLVREQSGLQIPHYGCVNETRGEQDGDWRPDFNAVGCTAIPPIMKPGTKGVHTHNMNGVSWATACVNKQFKDEKGEVASVGQTSLSSYMSNSSYSFNSGMPMVKSRTSGQNKKEADANKKSSEDRGTWFQ